MTPDRLTLAELVTRLRAWADTGTSRAAVELLVSHGVWLQRDTFLAHIQLTNCWLTGASMAEVDWRAIAPLIDAGTFGPASRSELAVLAVACSIGGGTRVDLRDALLVCDRADVRLIADAVLAAGGAR